MEDIGVLLHPLSKLKLYRVIKDSIFRQMDKEKITPERADEILAYVKKFVVDIEEPEMAKRFYRHLAEKFPELEGVRQQLELIEEEKVDLVIRRLIDHILKKGNFELASRLMEEIEEMQGREGTIGVAEKLEQQYPKEFEEALEEVSEENQSENDKE